MDRKYRLITIIIFFSFLFFLSCTTFKVPKYIQQHYTIKYPHGTGGLDSLININGYYSYQEINPNHRFIKGKLFSSDYIVVYDTSYINYVFFYDGMFLWNMGTTQCYKPECMEQSIERVNKDSSKKAGELLYGCWGSYKLSGDTIITQYIQQQHSLNDSWTAWQEEFKILDKNTIIQINRKPIDNRSAQYMRAWENDSVNRKYQTATFIHLNTLPKSNCWLKKERWFMQNDTIKNRF